MLWYGNHMNKNCRCIPELHEAPEVLNHDNYQKYEEELYKIMEEDFIKHEVFFLGKKVVLDFNKSQNGKSDTFFHVLCGDKKNYPNFERAKRIRYPRQIIENFNYCYNCEYSCKVKMFIKKIKNKKRYHLFSEENRYMVVLEDEGKRMKLVTSFYIDKTYKLYNYKKDYENYISKIKDDAVN